MTEPRPHDSSTPSTRPLDGVTVCTLVTNDVSIDGRVQKETATLAAAGAEVTVIGVGTGSHWEAPAGCRLRLIEPMRASENPVWPIRVLANLAREREFERRLADAAEAVGARIIHCNDLDTLWSGSRAARRTGARVVYDAHELSTEGGLLRPWKRALLHRREQRLARRAAAVIAVNRPIAEWLRAHCGLREIPAVVMNGPSACLVDDPQPHTPLRLLFQGQFFADRNLGALVEAVAGLGGAVELTLQGWGAEEERLRAMIAERGLEDVVRLVPACRPQDTVREAARHDVGFIVHKPVNLNHFYSSPNKLFDYLGGGLAIIASDLPVLREVVEGGSCGVLFDPDEAGALESAIHSLVEDPGRVAEMKANAAVACHALSWSRQAETLVKTYAGLLED